MSVLELERVSKRYRQGARVRQALSDASLELHAGEMVGIWGRRRSGRSTLLRIAAGLEPPDAGLVRLEGQELAGLDRSCHERIGYCHPALATRRALCHRGPGDHVLRELVLAQLARGVGAGAARASALAALERTGAQRCAELTMGELDAAEAVRVTLALALTSRPVLLVIDEPTKGVDLLERDPILALLRSLANEGMTILTCVGESTGLFGVDRALALGEGELHGNVSPALAPVVALPRRLIA